MNLFQLSLLTVFGVVVYMMIVDRNVADYINLLSKKIKLDFERIFWMIKIHPKNPITNLLKKWEYDKIAREMIKEKN